MKLGRVRIEIMALRAFVLDRSGEKSVALLQEAIDLANTYGWRAFCRRAPGVGRWAQRVSAEQRGAQGGVRASRPRRRQPDAAPRDRDTGRAQRQAWR